MEAKAVKVSAMPAAPPQVAGLLQRKCACGRHTIGGGECGSCKRGNESKNAARAMPKSELGSRETEISGMLNVDKSAFFGSRFARDFSRVPPNTRVHSSNGSEDDETLESVNLPRPSTSPRPVPTQPLPQAAPTCPTRTSVDTTTDLTLAGLQAGFLSAYGIIARMRVLPETTNWDGKQIVEGLVQTSSTCPAGLTQPGPCAGNSTFTVGSASGGSNVIPNQPAMRNRFYDFHTTRSRSISFLHDPTRNPAGLNSCETVCEQMYSCNGVPIGTHRITRSFSKSTFNGRNVTIVNVTKEDPVLGPGDFPRTRPRGGEFA